MRLLLICSSFYANTIIGLWEYVFMGVNIHFLPLYYLCTFDGHTCKKYTNNTKLVLKISPCIIAKHIKY